MQICTKTPTANPVAKIWKIWKRALGLGIWERELNSMDFAKFGISRLQIVETFFWLKAFPKNDQELGVLLKFGDLHSQNLTNGYPK